jgi:hypothetical protein
LLVFIFPRQNEIEKMCTQRTSFRFEALYFIARVPGAPFWGRTSMAQMLYKSTRR